MHTDKTWNEYYARQIRMPELGEAGQNRLSEGRVLVVGAGGLGSAASTYLALAGVGTIGIVDFDRVDLPNLHRQPLFTMADVGQPRAETAARALGRLGPWLTALAHAEAFTVDSGLRLAPDYDILLDCTDNMTARRDVNQVAVFLKKPFVYASVQRTNAWLSVFVPESGPCFHCLYPESREHTSAREAGVLGTLAGMIGAVQATEAIKQLAGIGKPAVGRLIQFEMDSLRMSESAFSRNPDCKICGPSAESALSGTDVREVSVEEFLDRHRASKMLVLDVREPDEYQSLHLRESVSIPLSDLPDNLGKLPRDRPILTICNAGIKSRSAARILKQHEFPDVFSLRGRILTLWKSHPDLFGA